MLRIRSLQSLAIDLFKTRKLSARQDRRHRGGSRHASPSSSGNHLRDKTSIQIFTVYRLLTTRAGNPADVTLCE